MKKLITILFSLILMSCFALPSFAIDLGGNRFNAIANQAGISTTTDLPTFIGNIIKIIFYVIGILLVVFIVYAGYLWLTAGGNEDQVGQAKAYLKNAIIGLIIVVSAYAITGFVVDAISTATTSGGVKAAPGQG